MVGRQLSVRIGNQRALRRACFVDQGEQARITGSRRCKDIPFDIEFDPVDAQRGQRLYIVRTNMALIRPRIVVPLVVVHRKLADCRPNRSIVRGRPVTGQRERQAATREEDLSWR